VVEGLLDSVGVARMSVSGLFVVSANWEDVFGRWQEKGGKGEN
jgi:hypothetical protein